MPFPKVNVVTTPHLSLMKSSYLFMDIWFGETFFVFFFFVCVLPSCINIIFLNVPLCCFISVCKILQYVSVDLSGRIAYMDCFFNYNLHLENLYSAQKNASRNIGKLIISSSASNWDCQIARMLFCLEMVETGGDHLSFARFHWCLLMEPTVCLKNQARWLMHFLFPLCLEINAFFVG